CSREFRRPGGLPGAFLRNPLGRKGESRFFPHEQSCSVRLAFAFLIEKVTGLLGHNIKIAPLPRHRKPPFHSFPPSWKGGTPDAQSTFRGQMTSRPRGR